MYVGATFAFNIYDYDGNLRLDLVHLGDVLRGLNLNPTLKMVEKFGGTDTKGVRSIDFKEFCKIYSNVKKSNDLGSFEDFFQCLKVLDKHQDGKLLIGDLEHLLLSKGNFFFISVQFNLELGMV